MRRFLLVLLFAIVLMSSTLTSAAHAATSAIDDRYWADSALRSMLGPPTGGEYSIADGRVRHYKWGNLYWSSDTGVHEVHGAIRWRYNLLGGPSGFLGFPTTDETRLYFKQDVVEQNIGARNDFEGGAINWSSTYGPKWMSRQIADVVPHHAFPDWGVPTTDEQAALSGSYVTLSSSTRVYATPTEIHVLTDGYPSGSKKILDKYVALGAHNGFLGLPRTGGSVGSTEGIVQQFQGGDIFQCGYLVWDCEIGDAYEIHGAIRIRFYNEGGIDVVGYPITDEQDAPGGRISHFQNASIFWNATTGQTTLTWN